MTPAVQFNAKPAPATKAAAKPLIPQQYVLPLAVGGAILLLAIAALATLIGRRRRRREQEEADARTMAYEEPFERAAVPEPQPTAGLHEAQPAAAEQSAFAWGNQPGKPAAEQDDRRPGETWVERAYRGPTPNNPSVSLRHRLSRAAFFDKREREARAGLAEPVDPSAGLPNAMVEERERESA